MPIAAIVDGYVGITENKGMLVGTKIRNEYNYFQFRSEVQKRKDLFSVNTVELNFYCHLFNLLNLS